MSAERFLVTGALGCIGAWVVRNLVAEGVPVVTYDLGGSPHRLELLLSPDARAQITMVKGDITDLPQLNETLQTQQITHVVHLAALQVPFCRANPPLGAMVNVVGTVNVFEALKAAGIAHLVYASSAAVYGGRDEYAPGLLPHDAAHLPHTLYGVYKEANEGTAKVYWQDAQISSIGLRPYTVYGVGRDQGMTSSPTQAMLAAARGEGFHIPFGGTSGYQWADDVAKLFIRAARQSFQGAEVFNLQGAIAPMREVIAAIESAAPEVAGRITYDEVPLPFPDGLADDALRQVLGADIPDTLLAEGITTTVEQFRSLIAAGEL